jgi:ABC-2 type transport system ATP-binding protein
MTPLLEVRDVRKNYGALTALDGVSLSVMPGELFGLLGPNGAGKTTLLSILSCLGVPTSGQVLIDGERVGANDLGVRRLIGIVPQDLAIYEQLTARENLAFFGELFGLGGSSLAKRVASLLVAVGLEARADDRAVTFSGGMKRRLNLAVALVHEPRLLLLDEPTVGVDPQSRNLIFEEVRRLNAGGLTVVYTSHYMEEVQALCTRIGIIDQGKLKACDTLPGLLQQLQGLVRCRLAALPPALRQRLAEIPGCTLRDADGGTLELHGSDVKGMLIRLIALLNEANVELIHLETEEPNLERVFLHLTGRALRD